jgi:predicted Rossmann fold nucleotide-binding protein DprA/Smf involved in DNA uptake
MTEAESIKAAIAKLASATEVYEEAKRELAALLSPANGGGYAPVAEPARNTKEAKPKPAKTDPALEAVKQRMTKGTKRVHQSTYAPPAVTGVSKSARIVQLLSSGGEWSVEKIANTLELDQKKTTALLSGLTSDGVIVRVGRGVYKKGAKALPAKKHVGAVNKDFSLPEAGNDGLTPRERAKVAVGQTRWEVGELGGQNPPTAEERVLAALGSGPKKWKELLELCSLSNQGASEAVASLARAGKVTSDQGVWKLKAAA